MHSKYDNMHKNGIFYALICIKNHIIACYQLSCLIHILPLRVMTMHGWHVSFHMSLLRVMTMHG